MSDRLERQIGRLIRLNLEIAETLQTTGQVLQTQGRVMRRHGRRLAALSREMEAGFSEERGHRKMLGQRLDQRLDQLEERIERLEQKSA